MQLLLRPGDTVKMRLAFKKHFVAHYGRRRVDFVIEDIGRQDLELSGVFDNLAGPVSPHEINPPGRSHGRGIDSPDRIEALFDEVGFAGFGLLA